MNIEKLREDQMKYYRIDKYEPSKFVLKNVDSDKLISQLCFILHYLIIHRYTLSYICLDDFEFVNKILFLKSDDHLIELDSKDQFTYKKIVKKEGICFIPNKLEVRQKGSIYDTYASVGLFVYYLFFKKVLGELEEKDFGKLKGTKPYYFIKNTMSNDPCLIYL